MDSTNSTLGWLAYALLTIGGMPCASADHAGLPVSPNAEGTNFSLTSPDLHPGTDVGTATGNYSDDGHKLTITQTSNTAILDWNSFNIAAGDSVQFIQPSSSSIALNEIHQLTASEIFGNLNANGQVYLINNNGFIFGAHASVNTNSLVATSLNITDSVFQQGIANVVNQNNNNSPVAAFSGNGAVYLNTGNGTEKIRILVEKGAQIKAADAGRVILAAPEVENDGLLSAPDGQVMLVAATDKVYLQESSSPQLRGMLVEVKTGGDVKNLGSILTERGNTTMMGFAVTQQGIITASTSVALNGSIRLLAREGAQLTNTNIGGSVKNVLEPIGNATIRSKPSADGLGTQASVTLEPGSSTVVKLDNSGGKAAIVAGQSAPQSIVDVQAGSIDMQNTAKIVAHGGNVNMVTELSPLSSNAAFPATPAFTTSSETNPSRILLETGSSIDVSGAQNVTLPMSSNVVGLNLYGYELRNAPLQDSKTGLFYGQNVLVDTRYGTRLADISGAVSALRYSVDYLNSNAGNVNLASEGDVIVRHGANIDISGGYLDYLAGIIQTTDVTANGTVYSLSNASPDLLYQHIFNTRYFEPGYLEGKNAGAINITSRDLILDGTLKAATVQGDFQRTAAQLAAGGQLNINTAWTGLNQQDVIFKTQQTYTGIINVSAIETPLYLSNALFKDGITSLNLNTGGNLLISKNTNLSLPDFGNLAVTAGAIDVEGSITAHAGAVSLKTDAYVNPAQPKSGEIHMAAKSIIDISGLWINDLRDILSNNTLQSVAINPGTISLQAQGDLLLEHGSGLYANGGAWLQSNQKLTAGKGGNISLTTAGNNTDTSMELGASLSSQALSAGGVLSITANSMEIANSFKQQHSPDSTLHLSAAQLESGGFSSYQLTVNAGNLNIDPNTKIVLQETNWQFANYAFNVPSGSELSQLVTAMVLNDDQRQPVDLALSLAQNNNVGGYIATRSIDIAANAVIKTDPNANISLNSDANIFIDGSLNTPAGNINITTGGEQPGYNPNQSIALGPDAKLTASGVSVMAPKLDLLTQGKVLAGGTVTLTANRGYILTDSHSIIDVSGTNALLDTPASQGVQLENIASAAGTISLSAAEGMLLQGNFLAHAGTGQAAAGSGSSVSGGSLDIELNAQNRQQFDDYSFPVSERIINVSADPVKLLDAAQISSGVIPSTLNGHAYISASQIQNGGFDNLKLATSINPSNPQEFPHQGAVEFNGDVNLKVKLSLELDTPLIAHSWNSALDSGKINLISDNFILGSSLNQVALSTLSNPDTGFNTNGNAAVFTVNANNILLRGASQVAGFAKTSLNSNGDISLSGVIDPNADQTAPQNLIGSLSLNGELDLSAREIFPTTLSQFDISINSLTNPGGHINIQPATGSSYTPLSAAGQISISAANIDIYGSLLAPFGSIAVNAVSSLTLHANSLVSVSDNDRIVIPFGNTLGDGKYWNYSIGSDTNILNSLPQKSISLDAASIDLQTGSVVNLNGGGDLQAYELVQAPGGSIDYLSPAYQQSFAILPVFKGSFSPYDSQLFPGSGLKFGENVYLSASADGLAAGEYVLLPAYDALLPGAFLVTPTANTGEMIPGSSIKLADSFSAVAGYLTMAGSGIADNVWSGFEIRPGSTALAYSPYVISDASKYFAKNTSASANISIPDDGGNLALLASQNLNLAGKIYATAATGGLGGQLDISGDNFEISNQSGGPIATDTLMLNASQLNSLASQPNSPGVDSILIGGTRTRTANGTILTVKAQNLDIAKDVSLQAPEILLAASNTLAVESGATIKSNGSLSRTDTQLDVIDANGSKSDAAIVRVSSAAQASVTWSTPDSSNGNLQIAAGASLQSSGSILLAASQSGSLLGNIHMDKGNLSLVGSLITLGGAANQNTGFQLSAATLNQLHVDNLNLVSSGVVNIADAINLQLTNLTVDSAGLYGLFPTSQTADITATGSISLQNSGQAVTTTHPAGQGLLQLHAATLNLGAGVYGLQGFSQIDLKADTSLTDYGKSVMSANGDLNITTPVWSASAGADTQLDMGTGNFKLESAGQAPVSTALGGKLQVNANQIYDAGNIVMGSGSVSLAAMQGLTLATGSMTDVAGRITTLGNAQVYSAGGGISLTSQSAGIDIQSGATLNLSGSSLSGNGGNLTLHAGSGSVNLAGNLNGFGYKGALGSCFSLAANSFTTNAVTGFSALNSLLQTAGFNGTQTLHLLGSGDLLVAANDKDQAANISLTADSGQITVAGKLDVSGIQAGDIQLAAATGVGILNGAILDAASTGKDNQGGNIMLTSAPISAQGTGVSIADGTQLNVSGATGGQVQIIVNRTGGNNAAVDDAAVNIANGVVNGASTMSVYAMQHYVDNTLSNSQFQQWLTDSNTYLSVAATNATLQNRLGGFELLPGLDIVSTAGLDWNINTALTGQVSSPGLLSIRAVGSVNIDNSLSDGFGVDAKSQELLLSGPTWSYNIVAGADLQSASIHSIQNSVDANLTIAANTAVRTGSGSIYMAAAGDVSLTDKTSTIYTAGQPTPGLSDPYAKYRAATYTVQYPDQGGNVTLIAGGNIKGADSTQLMSDWLQRSGNWNAPNAAISKINLPTAWGIDFGKTTPTAVSTSDSSVNPSLGFLENVGALGGGNVKIQAGNNITDLSVMLPTTAIATIVNGVSVLQEQGGGNLDVSAGGNIAGGAFYVEKGQADINAAGAITGGSQYTAGPVFAMGAAQFTVTADNGIQVGSVLNPFGIAQAGINGKDYFSTYSADSGINLVSLAGDISLNNNTGLIAAQIQYCSSANFPANGSTETSAYNAINYQNAIEGLLSLYPGYLTAYAINGGLNINASMSLYPAANSSLVLLANADLTFGDGVEVNQLDVDPSRLLPVAEPATAFTATTNYWLPGVYSYSGADAHAAVPLHQSDLNKNLLISAHGSITGLNNGGLLTTAKATDVSAAANLDNISLIIQNLNSGYQNVSNISAGGDILFPAEPNSISGALTGSQPGIEVSGPGVLNVYAGGNINLGVSGGITTQGALYNPALPSTGAGITVIAGSQLVGNSQPLTAYLNAYLNNPAYLASLSRQLLVLSKQPASSSTVKVKANLEHLLALLTNAHQYLAEETNLSNQLQIALPVLFAQLSLAASEANTSQGKAAYKAGFDAIKLLFPQPVKGDIVLDFSRIQTLQGGNIDLLAPGGALDVGLAASNLSTAKSPAELGIVAQGTGNVNILTSGDVQVNQSRVFTLEGGDITIWSSKGNIDAGRGSKSSLGSQLPIGSYDTNGNLLLEYPPTVSGSGIRAQSGYQSPIIGNVTLATPAGVVNADEAGIGGQDITIAAVAVIGAANIQVSGNTLGVPQLQTAIPLPDTAGGASAAASKAANNDAALEETLNNNRQKTGHQENISLLDIQVTGFGNCSISEVREGRSGCGR